MNGKNDRLVVAAIFKSDIDANISLGMLRANGIPCILNGEMANCVLGIQLAPSDGIRLLVNQSDLEEAQRLLRASDDI